MAGVYFSQTSVIYFCHGFGCCPYYRGVRKARVDFISAGREIHPRLLACGHTQCTLTIKYKNPL